eukprot:259694-Chlamydomonas_euryale.AAC.8
MGTDLVRYKDRWAAGVKEMRELFGKLEAEGYSRESQQVWRQYWDFQLYKALEYQYVQPRGRWDANKRMPCSQACRHADQRPRLRTSCRKTIARQAGHPHAPTPPGPHTHALWPATAREASPLPHAAYLFLLALPTSTRPHLLCFVRRPPVPACPQGLECINKTLPEVEVKMVFRQHKLQFDPPLEDIRMRHAKDFLNTFLGLPLRMKGVSDLSERPGFFQPIMDANTAGIAKVYSAAEGLFAQLSDELKKFSDWMAIGSVADLEEFVDEHLAEVADWELNFKVRSWQPLVHAAAVD